MVTGGAQIESEPYAGPLAAAIAGGGPRLLELWLAPIRDPLELCKETAGRPVAELTVPDLLSWVAVLGYAGLSGYVAGRLVGGLTAAAIRGGRLYG